MNRQPALILLLTASLCSCAETAGPTSDIDGETPPVDSDLISASPGGKFDTGYYSNLAAELEGVFVAEVHVDLSALSEGEREAELERLREPGSSELRRLVDRQIKFAKNQINASQLHLNLSSSDLELVDIEVTGAVARVTYETSVETIVTQTDLEESGASLEDVLSRRYAAVIPAYPDRMHSDIGAKCLDDEHQEGASDYNYFYYYEPNREGCAEAMAEASIPRIEAELRIRSLAPPDTVFPEYDQLIADGRIDVVAFFGAADHDWKPGEWDWGTDQRDVFVRDLSSRGFRRQEAEEGDLYTRTVGELEERVRVIGPETLKLLSDDSDGLFTRQVSASEIIFYNGHSFYGSLDVLDRPELYPGRYQIFFMNSCWSYEYYTKQIFRHNATEDDPDGWLLADVVNDTESGWFHNMGGMSRILLANLLAGAESGGVDGDRYFTWDRIIGKMNQEAIRSQQARGSKTHEIYGVSGVRTNRYDPTAAAEPGADTARFESRQRVAIPDDDERGASSEITVGDVERRVGSVRIVADIEHTYIGDLTVTLHHEGRYFTLHAEAGGSTDDLHIERVTNHFSGLDAEGEWVLKVVDGAGYDEGSIVGWSIDL